ncbi:MAG: hypothetical protein JXA94_04485 [Parachlamydiales bacterium]|nr:hypothetical protein [Parachlamydiales bacterium]
MSIKPNNPLRTSDITPDYLMQLSKPELTELRQKLIETRDRIMLNPPPSPKGASSESTLLTPDGFQTYTPITTARPSEFTQLIIDIIDCYLKIN